MATQRRVVTSKSGATWAITQEMIRPPQTKSYLRKARGETKKKRKGSKARTTRTSSKRVKAAAPSRPVLMLMAQSTIPRDTSATRAKPARKGKKAGGTKRRTRSSSGQMNMF